jgi:hypothetical protein
MGLGIGRGRGRAARRHGAALLVAALLAAALLAAAAGVAAAQEPTPGPGLAVGITEFHPAFVWPAAARAIPQPFARWRDELEAIRPAYHRLMLDWAKLQPDPDRPAQLDLHHSGCARGAPPCLPWDGVREQLEALAARQRVEPLEVVVVITGTPRWAASEPGGCERPSDGPRSRAPRDDALPAYGQLVADVLAEADRVGARLRFWSAWNEPNHPYFISPQREACDVDSPSLAIGRYLRLVGALREVLDAAPGEQELVLGDLAGAIGRKAHVTSMREFITALPEEVLCGAAVWAQHAYVATNDAVASARRALDDRGCPRPQAIWVTETGIGTARSMPPTGEPPVQDRPGTCGRLHAWLVRFYLDPRVTVAFQYTLREDDFFRVGLVTSSLERAYPTLRPWRAWGGEARPSPTDPPPSEAAACEDGDG